MLAAREKAIAMMTYLIVVHEKNVNGDIDLPRRIHERRAVWAREFPLDCLGQRGAEPNSLRVSDLVSSGVRVLFDYLVKQPRVSE